GPNDPYTLRLLDVLAQHDVKATFFMIGKYVRQRPDIVKKVADAGHVIGNHTETHPNLIFRARAELEKELRDCRNALAEVLPQHSNLFRPPFGGRRPVTLRTVRAEGLLPILWSVTCFDWKDTSTDRIERHALRQIKGGDVVLLHDGGHGQMCTDRSPTVEATGLLIRRYKDQGFAFVTIPEMMKQS
ncbi:MAG: polysaccharide deacetylase family protein, partial [Candidatus Acidiferrum sp.]